MKSLLRKVVTSLFALGIGLITINEASAQNFEMNTATATYNATCGAVIKMRATSSVFENNGGATLGTTKPTSIEGVVEWGATANGQTVQALYYDHMMTSGVGTKTIADGVYIVGGVCPTYLPTSGNVYNDFATYPYVVGSGSGANSYNGTFHYAGDVAQTVFPQRLGNGTEPDFANLDFIGTGTKTIPAGEDVGIAGQISSDIASPLEILGNLFLGTVNSQLDGTVTLNNAAATLLMGTGDLAFNNNVNVTQGVITADDGDGDVTLNSGYTLALAGTTSILDFGINTNLILTGDISNDGDGTNLVFDCGSTVTYNGAANQLVLPTITSNAYGNLVLANGAKRGGNVANYADNIYVCNDFSYNAGVGGGNFDLLTNSNILYMQAQDAIVTYTANEEVVGKMNRVTDGSLSSYTFNNAQTIFSLAADANNPTSFELDVRPGTAPYNYDGVKDVNRKINVTYSGNAGAFEWTAQAGYLFGEGPGGWGGNYTQASIRFYESDNVAADDEKVGTGNPYARVPAAGVNLGSISLAGIGNIVGAVPNGIGVFASANDLKLTAGPTTFYTVNDGRWTNPGTWDEGARPSAIDNTEIRNMVYVGIDGPFAGTVGGLDETDTQNTYREATAYPGGIAAANEILIASGYANASLIIGNEDNGVDYVFKTASTTAPSFQNDNTNAASGAFPMIDAKGSVTKAMLNGLWMVYNTNWAVPNSVPTFRTFDILNLGSINNEGIIEVGE